VFQKKRKTLEEGGRLKNDFNDENKKSEKANTPLKSYTLGNIGVDGTGA
jgi:hypothetical protein